MHIIVELELKNTCKADQQKGKNNDQTGKLDKRERARARDKAVEDWKSVVCCAGEWVDGACIGPSSRVGLVR